MNVSRFTHRQGYNFIKSVKVDTEFVDININALLKEPEREFISEVISDALQKNGHTNIGAFNFKIIVAYAKVIEDK